jgi:hypothetical protein
MTGDGKSDKYNAAAKSTDHDFTSTDSFQAGPQVRGRLLAANLGPATTERDEMRGLVKPPQTAWHKNLHPSRFRV